MSKCDVTASNTTHSFDFSNELTKTFNNIAIKTYLTATFYPKANLKNKPKLIYSTNFLANQTSYYLNFAMRDKNNVFATTDSIVSLNLRDLNDYRKIYPKNPFSISPDCKLMAIFSYTPLWVQIYNTTTLELTSRVSPGLQDINDDVQIAVSNNGIIAYMGNSIIIILDSKTNTKISDISIPKYVTNLKISGDGQIIVADSTVYKFNGSKYVENGKIEGLVKYVDATNPNLFYYLTKNYKLASKDLSINKVEREFPASNTLVGFDQFNNYFAYFYYGYVKVIDLNSGDMKYNINIGESYNGVSFIGNTLFLRDFGITYYLTVE
jgi:hypothetical protein